MTILPAIVADSNNIAIQPKYIALIICPKFLFQQSLAYDCNTIPCPNNLICAFQFREFRSQLLRHTHTKPAEPEYLLRI